MNFKVKKTSLNGMISIPSSKSHTIRATVIAALARGKSVIHNPLVSDDTMACVEGLKLLGASIETGDTWTINGFNGRPIVPDSPIDVRNSGTTMNILTAVSALADGEIELTGDESIRRRPVKPLLKSILALGASKAECKDDNNCPPVIVRGRMFGGVTDIEGITSQYATALLLTTPLLKKSTHLKIVRLNEKPYIDMTLAWLKKMGIEYLKQGRNNFEIPGEQSYYGFESAIPADFSSAAFPLIAALVTEGSSVLLKGLDMSDIQGDKKVFDIAKELGGLVTNEEGGIRVASSGIEGSEMDLNEIPDALPILSILGCHAEGKTSLINVQQARIKETDRITVMCNELKKMGADIEERPDGLVIKQSKLTGAVVEGHGDHRVVMALSIAGMMAEGETVITTAESVGVTFPGFLEKMKTLGADITVE